MDENRIDEQQTESSDVAAEAAPQENDATAQAEQTAGDTKSSSKRGKKTAEQFAPAVEAILFTSDMPLTAEKLAKIAELTSKQVKSAVEYLNKKYRQAGNSFQIDAVAGGYQMMTLPEYHDVLTRLHESKKDSRLSQASLETLAIVAYRQPILRVDIEAIRGVASGEMLRSLMEKQLVKIVGRAEVLGRPMLYGTTKKFLEVFGLNNLDDLPKVEELRGGVADKLKKSEPLLEQAGLTPPQDQTAESPAANQPAHVAQDQTQTDSPSTTDQPPCLPEEVTPANAESDATTNPLTDESAAVMEQKETQE